MDNKERPLVSVIILTYNQETFIKETINSILNQTYQNYEIIINDDGSTDKTREILMEYKKKYGEKIKLNLEKTNIGITNSCNKVIKFIEGEYVCWCGGDDIFKLDKIEKQVCFMETNKNIAISYHNIEAFNSYTNEKMYYMQNKSNKFTGSYKNLILEGCFMGACSVMYRAKFGKHNFDIRIPVASDWLYWILVAENGDIGYIDLVLSRYRRHNNNITNKSYLSLEEIETLKIIEEKKIIDDKSIVKAFARVYYSLSIKCLLNKDIRYKDFISKSVNYRIIKWQQVVLFIFIKLNLTKLLFKSRRFKGKNV